jgi:hypothetical protein
LKAYTHHGTLLYALRSLEAVRLHQSGETLLEISKHFGISGERVRQVLIIEYKRRVRRDYPELKRPDFGNKVRELYYDGR